MNKIKVIIITKQRDFVSSHLSGDRSFRRSQGIPIGRALNSRAERGVEHLYRQDSVKYSQIESNTYRSNDLVVV